jgi:hypothetical protein
MKKINNKSKAIRYLINIQFMTGFILSFIFGWQLLSLCLSALILTFIEWVY